MVTRRQLGAVIVILAVLAGGSLLATAGDRAFDAEEDYVADHLDTAACLEGWGTDEGAGQRGTDVVGLSPGGVRVDVTMPYAYETTLDGETIHADSVSEATYQVTLTGVTRLDGDSISPC